MLAARTNALIFSRRLATDGYSVYNSILAMNVNAGAGIWLRLMRLGDTFVGLYSTNGSDWVYGWFTTVAMAGQVQVGVAVTSHHEAGTNTVVLDNLTAGPLTAVTNWSGQKYPPSVARGRAGLLAAARRVQDALLRCGGRLLHRPGRPQSPRAVVGLAAFGHGHQRLRCGCFPGSGALTNLSMYYSPRRMGPAARADPLRSRNGLVCPLARTFIAPHTISFFIGLVLVR